MSYPIRSLLIFSLASAAHAQDSDDGSPRSNIQLEPITVTARHVEEDLRDIPFTVNVIGEEDIKQKRFTSIEQLLHSVPGVEMTSNGDTSSTNIRIRGIGSLNKTNQDDSSVLLYIDGVPHPSGAAALATLDIDYVEVLKGPQGTLFGRNTDGGAINIVTRKADFSSEGNIVTELGGNNTRMLNAVHNAELSDNLALRLAAKYQKYDNPVHNSNTNKAVTEPENTAFRANLYWRVSDLTDINIISSHSRLNDYANIYTLRPYGKPAEIDVKPNSIGENKDLDHWSIKMTSSFDYAELSSISAYGISDSKSSLAQYEGRIYKHLLGFVPADGGLRKASGDDKFISQEFRLTSTADSDIFWAAGLNYFDKTRHTRAYGLQDTFFTASILNADNKRRFKTQSQAVYGEVTLPISEPLSITTGLRYTKDTIGLKASWQANSINPNPIRQADDNQKLSDEYTTGRIAFSYQVSDQATLYGIYSNGYKTGGFSEIGSSIASGIPEEPYESSSVNAYESGIKYLSKNGEMRLEFAVYQNDNKDNQVFAFDPKKGTIDTENFDTQSKGAELELDWHPNAQLTLHSSIAYNDARIVSVPNNSLTRTKKNNRMPDSPLWSAVFSANHITPLSEQKTGFQQLQIQLSHLYKGERSADPENNFNLKAHQFTDLRISLNRESLDVYLWGNNIFAQESDRYGIYFPALTPTGSPALVGAPGPEQTFGLGLGYQY